MCWSTGIIFTVTRPATISRSLCRGLKRIASAPKRARSNRLEAVAISSMPQQAVAKGIGQIELRRAQLTTFFKLVVRKLSGRVWVSIYDCSQVLIGLMRQDYSTPEAKQPATITPSDKDPHP